MRGEDMSMSMDDLRFQLKVAGEQNVLVAPQDMQVKDVSISIAGNRNTVEFGSGIKANSLRIDIKGDDNSFIAGTGCVLSGMMSLLKASAIRIGDRTTMGKAELICGGRSIRIGADCMLSYGVVLRCSDTHPIYDISTKKLVNEARDVVVEDYVWIGKGVTIMKGVTVSAGAIVGIGSIVVKNIPAFTVAAGVPARVVRENAVWTRYTRNVILEEDETAMKYLRLHGRI
jgi:acetyltransferase-like isoleucine patch superfamily enzyme